MTRRNKLIILLTYLLILAVALPVYYRKRSIAVNRLKSEILQTVSSTGGIRTASLELERLQRLFPTEPGITAFIEDLYQAAQQSSLTSHEVTTEAVPTRTNARGDGASTGLLATYAFRISVEGNYRHIAEYVRRVQNLERLCRFVAFKFDPEKNAVKGVMKVELFSVREHNAR